MAPARNVSPAATTTRFFSARNRAASFPMNVVFPAPFTPMTRMIIGLSAGTNMVGSLYPARSAVSTPWRNAS